MLEQLDIKKQQDFFHSGVTKSPVYRITALKKLKQKIREYEQEIAIALYDDLGKSEFESYMTEIGIVYSEIEYAIKHLKAWSRPIRKKTPFTLFHAKSWIIPEPYGVVLIMSPWNYPFNLSLIPLVGALCAGNTVVLKPASYSQKTSIVIKKMLEDCYPEEYVKVMLGGREENQKLLDFRFDYIFFTGSVHVGKEVMLRASRNLIPVTLELGGKSPCIVTRDTDLKLAAKRIIFGKLVNAGQTCIAPDYVLVDRKVRDGLVAFMKSSIKEFVGDNSLTNPDYPKIINSKQLDRLSILLEEQNIVFGGKIANSKLEPTLIVDCSWKDPIMQEEIFGPILPIIAYDDIDSAIQEIASREKPLALYLFTNDRSLEKKVLNSLSFGGATINDTLMHFATNRLGFGGVGSSGMGRYHGYESFATFSNFRSVVRRSNWIDLPFRYHPYNEKKAKFLKKFLK